MSKLKYHVLLVGCGELGSRHLQALASLSEVGLIEVVDPRPQGLKLGRKRLAELTQRNDQIEFRWHNSIENASGGGDLCIVATLAEGRRGQIVKIVRHLGYRAFIIEKTVTQSVADYRMLMDFSAEEKLSIWVNCKTRAYLLHQKIKSRLGDSAGPLLFNVTGGNLGLVTNGIHAADLFAYYDNCLQFEVKGAYVDAVLHPSKRGPELFDLSGTLLGCSENGSQFTISYSRADRSPDHISILAQGTRFIIDHMNRSAWISETEGDNCWKPLEFEGNPLVSQMTSEFASEILSTGTCKLPTLEECYPAHNFILGGLLPHFNQLLGSRVDACPVT
jgi:hypothetical protein